MPGQDLKAEDRDRDQNRNLYDNRDQGLTRTAKLQCLSNVI